MFWCLMLRCFQIYARKPIWIGSPYWPTLSIIINSFDYFLPVKNIAMNAWFETKVTHKVTDQAVELIKLFFDVLFCLILHAIFFVYISFCFLLILSPARGVANNNTYIWYIWSISLSATTGQHLLNTPFRWSMPFVFGHKRLLLPLYSDHSQSLNAMDSRTWLSDSSRSSLSVGGAILF